MALHKGAVAQLQLYYFQSLTIARPMSAFKGSVQVDFCTGPVESLWKLVFTPFSLSTIYISNAESWICSISIISRWCIKVLPHSTFLSVISPLPPLNYPLILPLPSLSAPLPSYPECSADRRRRLSWAIKRRRVGGREGCCSAGTVHVYSPVGRYTGSAASPLHQEIRRQETRDRLVPRMLHNEGEWEGRGSDVIFVKREGEGRFHLNVTADVQPGWHLLTQEKMHARSTRRQI